MAEQVPYGLATNLISTLGSLTFKEMTSIYRVNGEIERLKETVEAIRAVLADADQKQQNEQLIQLWLRRLKRVLLKADDLFDDLHTQHLLRKRDGKGKVRTFCSSSNPIASRYKTARKIKEIRERFNAIAEDMSKLNLDRRVIVMGHDKSNWRETSSKPKEDIIGREENKKEIIDLLLNTLSNQNVSLVAIVGIGGLGKTALAQLAYNDAEVKKFFEERMWVCVSEDFDVKELVKKILESSMGGDVNDQQLELLQNKLEENLSGKKYLLVLDDVWNEDNEKWLDLRKYLMCGAPGSKILVTTRSQTVANKMGVETPYVLKGLTDDQSWSLLKKLAFGEDRTVTQNFESIGRKIAKKCGGVPLTMRAMGSMLQSKTEESDWEAVLEGDFWKLAKDNNSIMPILNLSYHNLSIELRQCFAYCSLYPKDWSYHKDDLIQLWMAQGYLECQNETQFPEDVGEQYVRILLMKSFFQDVEMDRFGGIEYFKMHDLMHDLSLSVAASDCCICGVGRRIDSSPMHLSFKDEPICSINILDTSRLRTILGLYMNSREDAALLNLSQFKFLRSLTLENGIMGNLPKSVGTMKHLRYLNLDGCYELISLPKTISNLVNLQTLILNGCQILEFSIDSITKLINLRHLMIEGCKAFKDGMPCGLERLTDLQSLSNFFVGNDDNSGRKNAKLNELKELNLRNTLVIENLSLVRDAKGESKDVNLKAKKYLKSLDLLWGGGMEVKNNDSLQLIENLCPHPNLRQLMVEDYPGRRFPGWLLSLTNLVELNIIRCKNCKYLPALDGFLSLRTLWIWEMDALEYICYEGCSLSMAAQTTNFFPSLEELHIRDCLNLRGWQRETDINSRIDDENHHSLPPFPHHLLRLEVHGCPNLSCMPAFPNVSSSLDLRECNVKPLIDTLKVRTAGLSSTEQLNPSLSMLEDLYIGDIYIEALPEEWMQNLISLNHLRIGRLSSPETVFCQMRHLPATLQSFFISRMDVWRSDEGLSTQFRSLHCLSSLQTSWN